MTIDVRVLLAEEPNWREYDPDSPMREVITLRVEAPSGPLEAAELAFAICNSYPGELHCPRRYAQQVYEYREGRNRSLSVGDAVIIGETTFSCDSVGFSPAETPRNLVVTAGG